MKTILKNTLHSALFLLILAALLLLISPIFRPIDNGEVGAIRDERVYTILGEPENTIDVLFIGDSLAQCSAAPLDLWREQGITSFVCASGSQTLYQSRDLLKEVFLHQSPKLVYLEADTIFLRWRRTDLMVHEAGNVFGVFRYHDRWKTMGFLDFMKEPNYTHTDFNRGFRSDWERHSTKKKGHMDDHGLVQTVSKENIDMVQFIQDLCAQNGATLLLYSAPSVKSWNYANHCGITAMAEQLGLEYMDQNLMTDLVPIDWQTDSMDNGNHLNSFGARKVTHYLGLVLAETGLFTDHRGAPGYEAWDADSQAYDLAFQKNA